MSKKIVSTPEAPAAVQAAVFDRSRVGVALPQRRVARRHDVYVRAVTKGRSVPAAPAGDDARASGLELVLFDVEPEVLAERSREGRGGGLFTRRVLGRRSDELLEPVDEPVAVGEGREIRAHGARYLPDCAR